MLGNTATRVILSSTKSTVQQRFASAVSGPATNHVSNAERVILGSFMCASLLVVPGWVLANIKNYRDGK